MHSFVDDRLLAKGSVCITPKRYLLVESDPTADQAVRQETTLAVRQSGARSPKIAAATRGTTNRGSFEPLRSPCGSLLGQHPPQVETPGLQWIISVNKRPL